MLHILFLILKIIGIILLAILGILVLLLCVILFVPAKYRLTAETTDGVDNLCVSAKASWFFHLLTARFIYQDKQSHWQVRIVWKKLKRKEQSQEPTEDSEDSSQEMSQEQEEEAAGKKEQAKESKQKKSLLDKIKCTIKKICDKIKEMWEMKEKITDFLTDDIHLVSFGKVKKQILRLAKRIRPRKIKGYVRFGLKEPYDTGRVLALLSVLYPFYGENVKIYPEFEHEILEGNIYLKGRIPIIVLVSALCNLFLDKDVKRTYKDYKQIKS